MAVGVIEVPKQARVEVRTSEDSYRLRLAVSDLLVVLLAAFGTQLAWVGSSSRELSIRDDLASLTLSYTGVSLGVALMWFAALSINGSRSHRVIGYDSAEYRLLFTASFATFGVVAIVSFLLRFDLSRGYILIAFPVGLLLLIGERWAWRRWMWGRRLHGEYCSKVLLVGTVEASLQVARELARQPEAGYRVVGACTPEEVRGPFLGSSDIPLHGTVERLEAALVATGADTVLISSSEKLPPERVRRLSWSLEAGHQHLVVAPSLTDIGGPRIHTRPVAGLPLIHVETPRYSGRDAFLKRGFDLMGSLLLILVLGPVFLLISLLVHSSGPGGIFYRQERIGMQGVPFQMVKFRSMQQDADEQLGRLLHEQGTDDHPLFKLDHDPRTTAVGRFIRKFSLDELPQLFNVLRGDMSLVGPRPQRIGEVKLYDDAAKRRLIAKPGMSGLWQVSGRSALSWEDSIRLDLYYVENWSLAGDLSILLKTARAVVAPGDTAH